MTKAIPKQTFLKDYRKPDFLIPEAKLNFDLFEEYVRVTADLTVRRHQEAGGVNRKLVLQGERQKLICVAVNGKELKPSDYQLTEASLTLPNLPHAFVLRVVSEIKPQENTSLEGLYQSGNIYCTQNEPEGFRRITYFLDRPDVMAKYTTTISAQKANYPVLLSNGNVIGSGDLAGGRHFVKWQDPFPKPSYLFALVAGDLGLVQDQYRTKSGRTIDLRIYVDKGNEGKCIHAMDCLKKAMKWDEETFGLECDLDTYMIVAVDAFNMGAMENKGLNIFNSQYVLADPKTATDQDYQAILSVIGHEYFHNWTGNRVTCRDWFQITLKEGLTIFRDQEFAANQTSRAITRISNVRLLRDHQFAEDAGPNRHPVRPQSYLEINNFYTPTVYHKGAEVIRMIHTFIGKEVFRRGIEKYFELFDGQAVTTDDFVYAMEQAAGIDLTQFKRWYDQAGAPICRVSMGYDEKEKTVTLAVAQFPPAGFSDQEVKPFHFPLAVGLLEGTGNEMPLSLQAGFGSVRGGTAILNVAKAKERFVFKNVPSKPIPSLLRDFSAPVLLEYKYSESELMFLLAHDRDLFNRYDAGQRLATIVLNRLIAAYQSRSSLSVALEILSAFGKLLTDESLDEAFRAESLVLPSVAALTEPMAVCDFEAAFEAREFFIRSFAHAHEDSLSALYEKCQQTEYSIDQISIGKRALKNRALAFLVSLRCPNHIALALRQFEKASNMTDEITALSLLCDAEPPAREQAFQLFYRRWKANPLVMNKWFSVQAGSKGVDVLDRIKRLEQDPAYDAKNPNKIRALIGTFVRNLVRFHERSGSGYQFVADKIIEIDRFNPQAAAHLAVGFDKFRRLDPERKGQMEAVLERIFSAPDLSRGTYEIISKTLG